MAKEEREPATMVSAARELGKLLGFYAPVRVEASLDVKELAARGQFERMTDEELMAFMTVGHVADDCMPSQMG